MLKQKQKIVPLDMNSYIPQSPGNDRDFVVCGENFQFDD